MNHWLRQADKRRYPRPTSTHIPFACPQPQSPLSYCCSTGRDTATAPPSHSPAEYGLKLVRSFGNSRLSRKAAETRSPPSRSQAARVFFCSTFLPLSTSIPSALPERCRRQIDTAVLSAHSP